MAVPMSADRESNAPTAPGGTRLGVVYFTIAFMVLAIVQLAGYRFAVNTVANDWYLFQVAGSTLPRCLPNDKSGGAETRAGAPLHPNKHSILF